MSELKNKIAFFCPYYRELPWYFNYFVKSCGYNQDVSFYIITDSAINLTLPSNIKVVRIGFQNLVQTISDKLNIAVNIQTPYKLCDFTPAHGLIFSDILSNGGYYFWGHCDIDVIFGRIRNFITDDLLETYDVISGRHELTSGPFMIYRNTNETNTLFKKRRDYEYLFSSPKNFCFDECSCHQRELLSKGYSISQVVAHTDAMTYVVSAADKRGDIKASFELFSLDGMPESVIWNQATLFFKNKYETLFYHLIIVKDKLASKEAKMSEPPDVFQFTPLSIVFIESDLCPSTGELVKLNKLVYMKDPSIQVVFRKFNKSSSGRFRPGGVLS